jgi:hypothetical protein
MSISVSKHSLQFAKRNLSKLDENSVISIRIEILRRSNALSPPLDTPNVVHVDFSVETFPTIRKTQSFKFRRKLCHFVPDRDVRRLTALSTPYNTPNVVHVDISVETIPANHKARSFKFRRKLCHFVPDRDTTAFKRSFKFRRKHCYLDPDCDVSTFKGSFHSIRHAVCSACRFQCRNNPCKSQNAIFQISMKTLSLRS